MSDDNIPGFRLQMHNGYIRSLVIQHLKDWSEIEQVLGCPTAIYQHNEIIWNFPGLGFAPDNWRMIALYKWLSRLKECEPILSGEIIGGTRKPIIIDTPKFELLKAGLIEAQICTVDDFPIENNNQSSTQALIAGEDKATVGKNGTFVIKLDQIRYNTNLSRTSREVYEELLSHAKGKNVCWPSHSRIAENLHIHTKTVQRGIKQLLDENIIALISRGGRTKDGKTRSNCYRILIMSERSISNKGKSKNV